MEYKDKLWAMAFVVFGSRDKLLTVWVDMDFFSRNRYGQLLLWEGQSQVAAFSQGEEDIRRCIQAHSISDPQKESRSAVIRAFVESTIPTPHLPVTEDIPNDPNKSWNHRQIDPLVWNPSESYESAKESSL